MKSSATSVSSKDSKRSLIFHADWLGQYKYDSFCMQSLEKRANKYLLLVTFETDDNYLI